uniref:Pro-corazonin n=1 Tax=Strigamia maritima TaxID=126957 RepID=T1JLF8_STRMM
MGFQKTKLLLIVASILVFIICTSGQTFQYSKGWEPGRKRAVDRSYQVRDWDAGRKRENIRGLDSSTAWILGLKRAAFN